MRTQVPSLRQRFEAGVDGFPRPVAFGEVPPRGPGVEDPKDAVDNGPVVVEGVPQFAVMGTVGQEGLDASPLLVREFVTVHGWPPVGNRPARELGLPLLYASDPFSNRA